MKGSILAYDEVQKTGVISGEDGKRYTFRLADWKQTQAPSRNASVDFNAEGDSATDIYSVGVLAGGTSNKIAAALLAFFLGAFGAHKFYLGYKKQGLIMLLTFLFGFILFAIPSMVIGVIALIEAILYITKSDDEFAQAYVAGRRPWF